MVITNLPTVVSLTLHGAPCHRHERAHRGMSGHFSVSIAFIACRMASRISVRPT